MLTDDPMELFELIESAREHRRKVCRPAEQLIRRALGSAYREGMDPDTAQQENVIAEIVNSTVPDLAFGTPAFSLSSPGEAYYRDQLSDETAALNTVARATKLARTLRKIAVDLCYFGDGWARVEAEPLPGRESDPRPDLRPVVRRVSPTRILYDPHATDDTTLRFIGEEVPVDYDDLMNAVDEDGQPMFDRDLLASIGHSERSDGETVREEERRRTGPERRIVWVAEVYVPERRMLYTLAALTPGRGGTKAGFLRDPREARCHPLGPWVRFPSGYVPDEVQSLGPLATARRVLDRLNQFQEAIDRGAASAKRLMFYDAGNKPLGKAVKKSPANAAVGIPNFNRDDFEVADFGGVHPDLVAHEAHLRERVTRTTGKSEAAAGQPDPDVKATADAIADRANTKRSRSALETFKEGVSDVAERCLWLLRSERSMRFMVSGRDQQSGEPWSGLYVGGGGPGRLGPEQGDVTIAIDPYSMEMVDQQTIAVRQLQFNQQLEQIGALILAQPHVNWSARLRDTGDALNMPDADKRYLNMEMLPMVAAMAGAGAPGAPGPSGEGGMPAPAVEDGPGEMDRLLAAAGGA